MTPSFNSLCGLAVLLSLLASCPTNGQDKAAIALDVVTVEQLQEELFQLKKAKLLPLPKEQQRVVVLLTQPHVQVAYTERAQEPNRLLFVRVMVTNLTDTGVEVAPDGYVLKVGNVELKPEKLPGSSLARYFGRDDQDPGTTLMRTDAMKLAPGEFGQTSLLFANLPGGQSLPEPLTLIVKTGADRSVRLDVIEQLDRQLKLQVERIGPRQMLAVLSIGGTLNPLTVWRLAAQLEKLAANRVARVVIRWEAEAPEGVTAGWLYSVAQQGAESQADNAAYPQLPASIAELHVVLDAALALRRLGGASQSNLHGSLNEAVSAALASAYRTIPRAELVTEIQSGHPLCRAAALQHGGGRLNGDDLPLVLKLTGDKSREMQRAALHALRNFGEPEAIAKLVEFARKDVDGVSIEALDSLAGSRFAVAHEALLKLLQSETQLSRKAIVQTLGRHPRAIWADSLYRFADDPQSGVRVEALNALAGTGHPQLFELLDACLKSDDPALSEAAFALLAQREDRRSEQVAVDWTLKFLMKNAPTPTMSDLLIRTKEQRAVPLLLRQIKVDSEERSQLIDLLGQIGDQTVFEAFTTLFDKVGDQERRSILTSLHRLKAPSFFEVAARCLKSSDVSLMSQACDLLVHDANPKSTELLIAAFQQVRDEDRFLIFCNALGNLSSPETRSALRLAARMPGNKNREIALRNALQNIYARSQTRQFVEQGRQFEQLKQHAQAAIQFDLAVKDDADSPEARTARGMFSLNRDDISKAREDYLKLVELDPTSSQGPTGLGIVLAREGKLDEAAKAIESVREKFTAETESVRLQNLFFYNAACVYGRAYEYATAHPEIADRDALLKQYSRKALDDLRSAINAELDDENREWMKHDPDLKSLHDLPEFKKLTMDG